MFYTLQYAFVLYVIEKYIFYVVDIGILIRNSIFALNTCHFYKYWDNSDIVCVSAYCIFKYIIFKINSSIVIHLLYYYYCGHVFSNNTFDYLY